MKFFLGMVAGMLVYYVANNTLCILGKCITCVFGKCFTF